MATRFYRNSEIELRPVFIMGYASFALGPMRFLLPVPNNSAVSQEKVRLAAMFAPDGWLQCRLIPCVYMKTPGR
jgi:hypothetical protein